MTLKKMLNHEDRKTTTLNLFFFVAFSASAAPIRETNRNIPSSW